MTWQQGDGDERRSTSPQAQERQDDQEYRRERRSKPSRSSSHTLVEASSIATEPDSLRSQKPINVSDFFEFGPWESRNKCPQ